MLLRWAHPFLSFDTLSLSLSLSLSIYIMPIFTRKNKPKHPAVATKKADTEAETKKTQSKSFMPSSLSKSMKKQLSNLRRMSLKNKAAIVMTMLVAILGVDRLGNRGELLEHCIAKYHELRKKEMDEQPDDKQRAHQAKQLELTQRMKDVGKAIAAIKAHSSQDEEKVFDTGKKVDSAKVKVHDLLHSTHELGPTPGNFSSKDVLAALVLEQSRISVATMPTVQHRAAVV